MMDRSLTDDLRTILDNLGRTENIMAALAINLATIAVGVAIMVAVDGVASFAGGILAILGALAIVRWVVGL